VGCPDSDEDGGLKFGLLASQGLSKGGEVQGFGCGGADLGKGVTESRTGGICL